MSSLAPPFTNLSEYAAAVGAEVPSGRAKKTDTTFVAEALSVMFSDDIPVMETSDIGDGTKKEWELGKTGEEFAGWNFGFSEDNEILVQQLVNSAPDEPPFYLRNDGVQYRIDERTVSGSQKLYLVFLDVPPASPSQFRVHWPRKWNLDGQTNELREGYQQGLVYLACSLKCAHLEAYYANTRTEESDLFESGAKVEQYRRLSERYEQWYQKAISRRSGGFRSGQITTGKLQIFPRGYA